MILDIQGVGINNCKHPGGAQKYPQISRVGEALKNICGYPGVVLNFPGGFDIKVVDVSIKKRDILNNELTDVL